MISNYNQLYIPTRTIKQPFSKGDTFIAPENADHRIRRFNQLEIEAITFQFENTVLHFNYFEWLSNVETPDTRILRSNSNKIPPIEFI